MKRMIIIPVFFLLFASKVSFPQAFIAVTPNVPMNTLAVVVKTDGATLEGKIKSSFTVNGAVKSFRLDEADGTAHKLKPDDVLFMKVKPGVLGKFDMINEKSSSIEKMANANFQEIVDREWIYYEQILSPGKNKTPQLLQKINPGFDNPIRVYNDPNAAQTGTLIWDDIPLTGGEDRSYIAVNGEGESFFIRKSSYDKHIRELLGHCEAFTSHFGTGKLKFSDLPLHIFYFNQNCKEQ